MINEKMIPVYKVDEGHGMLSARRIGNRCVIFSSASTRKHEPGTFVAKTEANELTPLFGIEIVSSAQARAWAKAFYELAKRMERDEAFDAFLYDPFE